VRCGLMRHLVAVGRVQTELAESLGWHAAWVEPRRDIGVVDRHCELVSRRPERYASTAL